MLQRMEKTGFIRREPDATDQRVSRVFLTDAGHAVKGQVEQVWRTLEAETFANLTADERALLRRLLLHLRDNLLKVTGEEPWK
jgi:DNA-binding MarR family transcriptional regulator